MSSKRLIFAAIGLALAACGRTTDGVSAAPAQTAGIAPIDLIACANNMDGPNVNDTAALVACAKRHAARRPAPTPAEDAVDTAAADAAAADASASLAAARAAQAARATAQAPPAVMPDSDTVEYDPNVAMHKRMMDDAYAGTDTCVRKTVQVDLFQGIRSRAEIVGHAEQTCTGLIIATRGAIDRSADARAAAEVEAKARIDATVDGWIETVGREGR
jgi:hypothetical protein